MNKIVVFCLMFGSLAFSSLASQDNFSFDDPAERALFLRLTNELRCPMCQNQNIADSDAMIAHDMRRKVYSLLKQGKSEQEVIDYMKARYGDFVYYNPPVTFATVWLWLLPVLFAVGAGLVIIRRRKPALPEDMAVKLEKANKMLEQDK
ncbi:cytochrome c-type biogenesis protein CcmH [Alteromonas pelagimontana]|uniref:Cytochrome c-type biogenesis protein n=1 Tax=Alteromonas pelagimontana TaxID=1858656 RepID=A0A6M4MGI5_9ALTE|nr:cytochrome c-type biogenesis protein [Alteromonas pelagimontana]QJR81740.1 cytochrome c-type biogenesis protein CcmH [Alteromonas pelagimontana]